MVQSVIIYSEIIPTILAVIGVYLIATGILDKKQPYLYGGIGVFLLAVIVPFVILSILI